MPLRPEQEYSEYTDRYINWNGLLEELKACINAVGGTALTNSTQYEDSWRGVQLALSQLRSQLLTFSAQVSTNVGAAQALLSQKGQPLGIASLDASAKLPLTQLPALPTPTASQVGAISINEKATPGGVATLGNDGILAAAQRPIITPASIGAIPSTEKAAALGVATLGADQKVPTAQLPAFEAPGTASGLLVAHTGATDPHAQYATDSDLSNHTNNTNNPHAVTPVQIGAIASTEKAVVNGVATLGADGKLVNAQLPAILPNYFTHWHDESLVIQGGTLSRSPDTNQRYSSYAFQNPAALGDEFQFLKPLAAGNYTLYLLGMKANVYGMATVRVNGNIIGVMDLYAASATPVYNVIISLPFSLSTSGIQTFNFKIESKNSSSSNYYFVITKFWVS